MYFDYNLSQLLL